MVFRYVLPTVIAIILNSELVLSTPSCNDSYTLKTGEIYNLLNPEKDLGGRFCQWSIHSEPGTNIALKCPVFNLVPSPSCSEEGLTVSLNGDYKNSSRYCGNENIDFISETNSIAVGYSASNTSKAGEFACTLEAVKNLRNLGVSNCECGWRRTSLKQRAKKPVLGIVGGYETTAHEFPSMAGLVDLTQNSMYCGGAIISTFFILTAGHCLYQKNTANIAALVGGHDINNLDNQSVIHRVNAYEIHPNFDADAQVNDIGIMRVSEAITFTVYVGPACFPVRYPNQSFVGQNVIAVGWGAIGFSEQLSPVLREVTLPVISNAQCATMLGSTILSSQMCTYTQGRDTCQGDSGGPLYWWESSTQRLILAAIISYGSGCADAYPGISTAVNPYINWIVTRTGISPCY